MIKPIHREKVSSHWSNNNQEIIKRAKELRWEMTPTELCLWTWVIRGLHDNDFIIAART